MKTHVVKVSPEMTLAEAADLMDLYQVAGLPVVDDAGILCGMLTESDVVRALSAACNGEQAVTTPLIVREWTEVTALSAREAGKLRVSEWMTSPAVSIAETCELPDAVETLFQKRLKRLPVVDARGEVVGVLNRIDVLQAIFEGDLKPCR